MGNGIQTLLLQSRVSLSFNQNLSRWIRVIVYFFFALDHYTFNLYCKQNCTRELSNIKGEVYPNVMATHYEYLQLSYYKGKETNYLLPCNPHVLKDLNVLYFFLYFFVADGFNLRTVNDIEKACRAIGSFLLFYPENEDMLANIKYYKEEYSVPDSYFKPRSVSKLPHYHLLGEAFFMFCIQSTKTKDRRGDI